MSPHWSAAVGVASPDLVLPDGERRARVAPPGPLRAVDVLALDGTHAVAIVEDGAGGRWTVPMHDDGTRIRRARPGDGTAEALLRNLADLPTRGTGFRASCWHLEPVSGERAVTADQTNESVVVGERAIVKWSVHLPRAGDPGSPAGHRISALVRAGFDAMPRPWAVLERVGARRHQPVLVATVVDLLPEALDGWDWAVEDVRLLARGDLSEAQALEPARVLGDLTARMHVALAGGGRERASSADVTRWRDRAVAELADACASVTGAEGERLVRWAPGLEASYDALLDAAGTVLTYGHGDLHVGQVLRNAGGYAVTDFDGNPVLDPPERVGRRPPAADVAGMCASLDHVGRVVLHRAEGAADTAAVGRWIAAAQDAYLTSYRAGLWAAGAADLLDERLLVPLRLAQEVREYLYAVRHLPHWVYVPDLALTDLLGDPDESRE